MKGIVVTRHGALQPAEHIQILHATHPRRMRAVSKPRSCRYKSSICRTADDLIINLLSGGGSLYVCARGWRRPARDHDRQPPPLLKSGAAIEDINIVRKHNRALGGGLVKIAPDTRHNTRLIRCGGE